METNNLIENLAKDLQPVKAKNNLQSFIIPWILRSTLYFLALIVFLPASEPLVSEFNNLFILESILWLSTAIGSLLVVYASAIPSLLSKKHLKQSIFPILLLVAILLVRENWTNIFSELSQELSFWRGRCGFIVLAFSLIESSFLGRWMAKQAPTNEALSGVWIAIASGSMASFYMQFVCHHGNSLHLAMWHFGPIFILSYLGAKLGRYFFRW